MVTHGVTWKKEAETEGGGFRSSTSTGSARKTHMMLSEQDGCEQQFESAQSTRPSGSKNVGQNVIDLFDILKVMSLMTNE